MKSTKNNENLSPPLRNVLYEFAVAQERPDASLLNEYVRRYPEYTAELTALAVELAVDHGTEASSLPVDKSVSTVVQSPEVLRMVSRFQNRLHQVRQGDAQPSTDNPENSAETNPFASLNRSEVQTFLRALNVTNAFFVKLRDCQILLETMSQGFVCRVSELLQKREDSLYIHFAKEVKLQGATSYKAKQKPTVGRKQTFEEAVSGSGLTMEQQEALRQL
jgi:hypothetical protein